MSAQESTCGHSLLRFSSVSSDDSLPLGCEHKEYYWIKRYRALKRSIDDDRPTERAVLSEQDAHKFKRLPCTRFYLDRDYSFLPDLREMLQVAPEEEASGRRLAMLRTQESLVISAVSSRWFHLEVARNMTILVGATNEGKRLQPQCLEEMKVVHLEVQRGDKVKLLVSPALSGYGRNPLSQALRPVVEGSEGREAPSSGLPPSSAGPSPLPAGAPAVPAVPEDAEAPPPAEGLPSPAEGRPPGGFRLKGDLTIFVNDRTAPDLQLEHEFMADENCPVYGLAVWAGTLSDVKVVEY